VSPSWRKPVGIGLILLLVTVWCIAVASFATAIGRWHWSAQAIFYAIAGTAWILPLKPLLRWMELGRWRDQAKQNPAGQTRRGSENRLR